MTTANPIAKARAIEAFHGNASALARALNISPQAVYQWGDDAIPDAHALRLRYELLPDYPWDRERTGPEHRGSQS